MTQIGKKKGTPGRGSNTGQILGTSKHLWNLICQEAEDGCWQAMGGSGLITDTINHDTYGGFAVSSHYTKWFMLLLPHLILTLTL